MKKFFYIILAIALFSACEKDEFVEKQTVNDSEAALTRASMISTFSYDSIKAKWDTYTSLVERYEVCQIPEKILPKLPTDLLVRLCLEHPLMDNYIFFNNEVAGMNVFYDNYNGLQALCEREDAGSALLTALADTTLSTFEFGFIEILLGSGKVSLSDSLMNSSLYSNAIQARLGYLNEHSYKYSSFTSNRNLFLQASVNARMSGQTISPDSLYRSVVQSSHQTTRTSEPGDIIGNIYVYTIFGKAVSAVMRLEITADEAYILDTAAINNHPNAVIIEPSSYRYNCHGYAWSMCSDNPVSCWIEGGTDSNPAAYISSYWTNDAYIATTSDEAERVFYPSNNLGDEHSAVVSTTYDDKYESKWGPGPLMAHAPTDCPFMTPNTELQYFKKDISYGRISKSLSGNDLPVHGNSYRYTAPSGGRYLTIGNWYITDHKGDEANNVSYSTGSNYIDITFLRTGEYDISCNYYYNGINVGRAEIHVDCLM